MNKLLFFLLVLLVAGCREKFVSPAPAVTTGYLVIEGIVNNGGGSTNIRLSRTTSLNDTGNISEKGAVVNLESSNNSSMPLAESSDGNYTIDDIHLDTTLKYRLSVKTNNNEEYLSDFVSVKNNPPIDSVSWINDKDGVTLYINTHDPKNNTLYYQWEYNETWEFHSSFSTYLKWVKDIDNINVGVTYRDANDPKIYTCWQFNASSSILLGSSAKLSRDVIYLPLLTIPPESWKLSVLYSILVKQYAWSKEGFDFLQRMKKNTESLGSVFDPQPSELNGNVHCTTDPNKPVIGFFNICTIQEQRIFIYNAQLPNWNYRTGCVQDEIENLKDSIAKKAGGKLPTSAVKVGGFGAIITFDAADAGCVDCTLKGTNVKPAYWP